MASNLLNTKLANRGVPILCAAIDRLDDELDPLEIGSFVHRDGFGTGPVVQGVDLSLAARGDDFDLAHPVVLGKNICILPVAVEQLDRRYRARVVGLHQDPFADAISMRALTWDPGRIEATIGYLFGTVGETVLRREHRACTISDAARTVAGFVRSGGTHDRWRRRAPGWRRRGRRKRRCGVAARLTLKKIATALRRREPEGKQKSCRSKFRCQGNMTKNHVQNSQEAMNRWKPA